MYGAIRAWASTMLGQSGGVNVPFFASGVELICSRKFLSCGEHSQEWLCHREARRFQGEMHTVVFHNGNGIVASELSHYGTANSTSLELGSRGRRAWQSFRNVHAL